MPDILVTVSAGVFGLLGAGLLSLAFGPLLWRRRAPGFVPSTGSLVVLIPAHQEERSLPDTLKSIQKAASKSSGRIRIVVGADSCSDLTEKLAHAEGAQVERFSFHSKWKTLEELSKHCASGDWVALVDSGAIWPENLLLNLSSVFQDEFNLGIAPAYYPKDSSRIERLLWTIEAGWKRRENRAGGPISVHGATVFYRAEVLKAAFEYLKRFKRATWLNDDVVLSLAARSRFPGAALVYWCPTDKCERISDTSLHESEPQFGRRRRMVAGNLEWAISLFPNSVAFSPAAALVATRRIFRIFWAYWVLSLAYAPCYLLFFRRDLAIAADMILAGAGALSFWVCGKRGIVEAAAVSLAAPFYIYSVLRRLPQVWG